MMSYEKQLHKATDVDALEAGPSPARKTQGGGEVRSLNACLWRAGVSICRRGSISTQTRPGAAAKLATLSASWSSQCHEGRGSVQPTLRLLRPPRTAHQSTSISQHTYALYSAPPSPPTATSGPPTLVSSFCTLPFESLPKALPARYEYSESMPLRAFSIFFLSV